MDRDQRLPQGLVGHSESLPDFPEEPWSMLDNCHLLVIFVHDVVNGCAWVLFTKLTEVHVMHSLGVILIGIKVKELLLEYVA